MNSALGPLTGRGLLQIPLAIVDPPSAESEGNFPPSQPSTDSCSLTSVRTIGPWSDECSEKQKLFVWTHKANKQNSHMKTRSRSQCATNTRFNEVLDTPQNV